MRNFRTTKILVRAVFTLSAYILSICSGHDDHNSILEVAAMYEYNLCCPEDGRSSVELCMGGSQRCRPLEAMVEESEIPVTIGEICTDIVGDNLEVNVTLSENMPSTSSFDGCVLTETHICNIPVKTFKMEEATKRVEYSVDIEDVYGFVCTDFGGGAFDDIFTVFGHATAQCNERKIVEPCPYRGGTLYSDGTCFSEPGVDLTAWTYDPSLPHNVSGGRRNVCHDEEPINGSWGWSQCGYSFEELNGLSLQVWIGVGIDHCNEPDDGHGDWAGNLTISVTEDDVCFDFVRNCNWFLYPDGVDVHIGSVAEPLPSYPPGNTDSSTFFFRSGDILQPPIFICDHEYKGCFPRHLLENEFDFAAYCIAIRSSWICDPTPDMCPNWGFATMQLGSKKMSEHPSF